MRPWEEHMSGQPLDILVIVGSLRTLSYNRMLARAAADAAPADVTVTYADIAGLPLFNEDLNAERGLPAAVEDLKRAIRAADAVLVVTPEYNYSVPGVLKNAIDWASHGSNHPFKGKPMAVMGASTGRFGTVRMQGHLRAVLAGLGALLLAKPEVMLSDARAKFDADGCLADERSQQQVKALMDALVAWTRRVQSA